MNYDKYYNIYYVGIVNNNIKKLFMHIIPFVILFFFFYNYFKHNTSTIILRYNMKKYHKYIPIPFNRLFSIFLCLDFFSYPLVFLTLDFYHVGYFGKRYFYLEPSIIHFILFL